MTPQFANATKVVTGNTGNAVQDGTVRGGGIAAIMALLVFVDSKTDAISAEDLVLLTPFIAWGYLVAMGIWDKFTKSKP